MSLLAKIQARLYAVPPALLGDTAVLTTHTDVFFDETAAYLARLLPRPDGVPYNVWGSWDAVEQTVLADMVLLYFLDRLLVSLGSMAANSASTVTVSSPESFVTKAKAGPVEAEFANKTIIQGQTAGTVVVNVTKTLELIKEQAKNRILSAGNDLGIDLSRYVGEEYPDTVRPVIVKL